MADPEIHSQSALGQAGGRGSSWWRRMEEGGEGEGEGSGGCLYSRKSREGGLRKLANELDFTEVASTPINEDCTAVVALSEENRFRNRSKHIALRWAYISERQSPAIGDVEVILVSRTRMLADIFASPRPAATFVPFYDSILGRRDANPSTEEDAPTRSDPEHAKHTNRLPPSTLLSLLASCSPIHLFFSPTGLSRGGATCLQAPPSIDATISLDTKDTVLDQTHSTTISCEEE